MMFLPTGLLPLAVLIYYGARWAVLLISHLSIHFHRRAVVSQLVLVRNALMYAQDLLTQH